MLVCMLTNGVNRRVCICPVIRYASRVMFSSRALRCEDCYRLRYDRVATESIGKRMLVSMLTNGVDRRVCICPVIRYASRVMLSGRTLRCENCYRLRYHGVTNMTAREPMIVGMLTNGVDRRVCICPVVRYACRVMLSNSSIRLVDDDRDRYYRIATVSIRVSVRIRMLTESGNNGIHTRNPLISITQATFEITRNNRFRRSMVDRYIYVIDQVTCRTFL